MIGIHRLANSIQHYAWGSREALARLQGRPAPSPEPEAELWIGAHPSAPSRVVGQGPAVPLSEWIARAPERILGSRVQQEFGELPFLLKVLAVAAPLSIQAHPSAEQARAGFAREDAAGIPRDAPRRSYRDPNPKPELICALSRFEALCGFRPPAAILRDLEAADLSRLRGATRALAAAPDRAGLARFFEDVMPRPASERSAVVEELVAAASSGRLTEARARRVAQLDAAFPGDVGVLGALLLNDVELTPGEALYLPAGELHAYLSGIGVEIMASSDNVLRGGLTPKHVDVPELLATLTFAAGEPPVLRAVPLAPGIEVYATPAMEFALSVIRPGREGVTAPRSDGIELLLVTEGRARVSEEGSDAIHEVTAGEALVVPACLPGYAIRGACTVFRATVPG